MNISSRYLTFLAICYFNVNGLDKSQYIPSNLNDLIYPVDGLNNPGDLYSFGGGLPPARVHHTLAFVDPFVIVHGGYSTSGALLDDLHMYDTRTQSWSGVILRRECCNSVGSEVESMALEERPDLPHTRPGFQGEIPSPRALHQAVGVGRFMYLFGGKTQLGLLQDFYQFDPVKLLWTTIDYGQGRTPGRRCGHAMVSASDSVYLFGGRGMLRQEPAARALFGYNDLWRYDTKARQWTLCTQPGSDAPAGREQASIGLLESVGILFVFGGLDPSSGLLYSDLWALSLGSFTWTQLTASKAPSPSTVSFSPPPMLGGTLIPVDIDCLPRPSVPASLFSSSATLPSSPFDHGEGFECGLLLYGGKGGDDRETLLGQVYRITPRFKSFESPRSSVSASLLGDSAEPASQGIFLSSDDWGSWEYARLTTADTATALTTTTTATSSTTSTAASTLSSDPGIWPTAERGRLRKDYALEKVVCSMKKRRVCFEFGGMHAVRTDILSNSQTATGLYVPLSVDSGGFIGGKLWDTMTGEHLRTNVDLPANGGWNYTDGFVREQPTGDFDKLSFVESLRQHRVNYKDLVLIYVSK